MRSLQRLLLLAIASLGAVGRFSRGQTVVGENPAISVLSTSRPVESSSVCGESGPEDYCAYTADEVASLSPNCMLLSCNNMCPFSSSSPIPLDLGSLSSSFGSGISATQGRPGSTSSALRFQNSSISIPAASTPIISDNGFSLALWINQDEGNQG